VGYELSYTIYFSILINRSTSGFFRSGRGKRKGYLLSTLLFLIVTKDLGTTLRDEKRYGNLKGLCLRRLVHLSHPLFVDDILLLCYGTTRDTLKLK
jgi:hypothetical protein